MSTEREAGGREADAAELARLVEQEAALRRLAELAARGAERQEVFDAIVVEASRLLGPSLMTLVQIDPGGTATFVALRGSTTGYASGTRLAADGGGVFERVLHSGKPARVDYADLSGFRAEQAIQRGFSGAVGAPIHVNGRLWGALVASAREEPLPLSLDTRLATFAELLGPAIAGALARAELLDLLDEQAALRRVAELVARGCSQQELFQAVADEASRLVDGEGTTLLRLAPDRRGGLVLATSGAAAVPVGTELTIPDDDEGIVAAIIRNRAPARVDNYPDVQGTSYARDDWGIASAAGVPIILDDELWGLLAASTWDHPLPKGVEQRLQQFAELTGAALANSAARAEVEALATEQAALRRVAELVARAAKPEDVFAAIAREAAQLLAEPMMLVRIDDSDTLVVVASVNGPSDPGWSIAMSSDTLAAEVVRTGRAARKDEDAGEEAPRFAERPGASLSAVAAPITIGGRIWGMLAASSAEHMLPAGTEERLGQFAELIAVAIANAESRAALSASRARVLATADEVRRRIQRDVHDGAQQRLVHTVLTLKLAREALLDVGGPAAALVDESLEQAQRAVNEMSDIVRGILPAALTRGGLRAGVESLVVDLPLDIDLRVECDRLSLDLETTAYFVAAESLTNVVKHAHADRASVSIRVEGGHLVVEVADEGVGGAQRTGGTGITGLFDRIDAAGGTLTVTSPPGEGTTVCATLPLDGAVAS